MPDIDSMLEANRNLSEKVSRLQEEVRELAKFKEMWLEQQRLIERLDKQLEVKRKVMKVLGARDGDLCDLMVLEAHDTPEGMYIKVELPK